ncbi:hypothetical protein GCM10027344_14100 [Spelaeicoccus albus]
MASRWRNTVTRLPNGYRLGRLIGVTLVCVGMLSTISCSTNLTKPASPTATAQAQSPACDSDSCRVKWGVAVPNGSASDVHTLEQRLDQRFDFVYTYHDIDGVVPSHDEKKITQSGHQLHISIIPRDFAAADKNTIKWKDVAQGRYDADLTRQAQGIAELPGTVYVTFDHEPDQTAKRARGTVSDYVSAWRHVHHLYRRLGVDNVKWVWVMMGWKPAYKRAGQLWPGNKYVDWISWEAYNHSGCQSNAVSPTKETTFSSTIKQTFRWIHRVGAKYGIDARKPMMISESATVLYPQDPERTAQWYADIPRVLSKYPQIRAITLFDLDVDDCNFRFQEQPRALAAVRDAMTSTRGG